MIPDTPDRFVLLSAATPHVYRVFCALCSAPVTVRLSTPLADDLWVAVLCPEECA